MSKLFDTDGVPEMLILEKTAGEKSMKNYNAGKEFTVFENLHFKMWKIHHRLWPGQIYIILLLSHPGILGIM